MKVLKILGYVVIGVLVLLACLYCAFVMFFFTDKPRERVTDGSYQLGEEIRLYEGEAPGSEGLKNVELYYGGENQTAMNVTVPTLIPYLPNDNVATDAAVIVCPGGANFFLSMDDEGHHPAQWFAQHGLKAFVLKYRPTHLGNNRWEAAREFLRFLKIFLTGKPSKGNEKDEKMFEIMSNLTNPDSDCEDMAVADGKQAIRYLRAHAEEYGIDPNKICIMGFSNGGILSNRVAYTCSPEERPDMIGPIYGPMDYDYLPENPMPLFAAAPELDLFGAPTTYSIYKNWQKAGVPAELHYFAGEGVAHGFAYRKGKATTDIWIKMFYNFMIKTGFVPEKDVPTLKQEATPEMAENAPFTLINDELTAYIPDTTATTGVGVVICPSGQGTENPEAERSHVAEWLAKHGIAAFVMKDAASMDMSQAMSWVRSRTQAWGIDNEKVGVMGFAEGAEQASMALYQDSKPAFAALLYGASEQEKLPEKAAPIFIVAPELDKAPGTTGYDLFLKWHDAQVPAELHYFPFTEHGFGYQQSGEPVNVWLELFYNFLIKNGFVNTQGFAS